MTIVGFIDDEEFVADFPIDFGKGVRGQFVAHRKKIAGVVLCHRTSGDVGCATSVFWMKVNDQRIYTMNSDVPLTIEEKIKCSCGMMGHIKDGIWLSE